MSVIIIDHGSAFACCTTQAATNHACHVCVSPGNFGVTLAGLVIDGI